MRSTPTKVNSFVPITPTAALRRDFSNAIQVRLHTNRREPSEQHKELHSHYPERPSEHAPPISPFPSVPHANFSPKSPSSPSERPDWDPHPKTAHSARHYARQFPIRENNYTRKQVREKLENKNTVWDVGCAGVQRRYRMGMKANEAGTKGKERTRGEHGQGQKGTKNEEGARRPEP